MENTKSAPQLTPGDSLEALLQKAVSVRPSPNQLAWHRLRFTAFLHFGMNTFTDREWGDGTESPALFNPTDFDAEEMISIVKEGGMTMAILTCKHHDGFCLWPSQYTDHTIAHSPYQNGKGDIVREISDACQKLGVRFGVYLSPWDRHDSRYGDSPAYNDYYINQLTELLTQYGEISDVWLDGACAEGPNGKKQEYDWQRIYSTVRRLAPQATITGVGPDVRWCGNEAGKCRKSEWSVVPIANTEDAPCEESRQTCLAYTQFPCEEGDLGSRERLAERAAYGDRLYWYPAQVDLSIRPGWFYHASEDLEVRTVEQLLEHYFLAVGGNTQLLLNLPPDKRGRIFETDAQNLRTLGRILRETFSRNLLEEARLSSDCGAGLDSLLKETGFYSAQTQNKCVITADFTEEVTFDVVSLEENLADGQRVEEFSVEIFSGESWREIARSTVIGSQKLIRLPKTSAKAVRVRILKSRAVPELASLGVFLLPEMLGSPVIKRDAQGMVSVSTEYPAAIRYTTDGSNPQETGAVYQGPFPLPDGGTVRVKAEYDSNTLQKAIPVSTGEAGKTFGLLKKGWKILSTSGGEKPGCLPDSLLAEDDSRYVVVNADAYTVAIDLGKEVPLAALLYLPVTQDPDFHFNCCSARLAVSQDGVSWEEIPEKFQFDNIYHNPKWMNCPLPKICPARYVRITLLDGLTQGKCAAAEFGFLAGQAVSDRC